MIFNMPCDSLKDCYVVLDLNAAALRSCLSYVLTLSQWSAFTAVPVAAQLSLLLMNHCRFIYCASGEEGVHGESRSFSVPSWLRYGRVHSRQSRNENEINK